MTSPEADPASSHGTSLAGGELVTRVARSGWVVRGLVYVLVGVLAYGILTGPRFDQEDADQAGALQAVAEAPAGTVILVLFSIGLAMFALWQAVQLWLLHGQEIDTWLERIAKVFGIFFYGSLAWTAIRLSVGDPRQSSWTVERLVSWTLGRPLGRLAIAIAAGVVVAVAIRRGARTFTGDFSDDLDLDGADPTTRTVIEWLGRLGELGRAVSFVLIGWFLLGAAWSGRGKGAGGLNRTLLQTADDDIGAILVATTATGFVLYGVFSMASARYRSLDPN